MLCRELTVFLPRYKIVLQSSSVFLTCFVLIFWLLIMYFPALVQVLDCFETVDTQKGQSEVDLTRSLHVYDNIGLLL